MNEMGEVGRNALHCYGRHEMERGILLGLLSSFVLFAFRRFGLEGIPYGCRCVTGTQKKLNG